MANATQIELDQRPIALDLLTRMMIPDGTFVRSLNSGMAIMRVKLPNPWHETGGLIFPDVYLFDRADSDEITIQNLGPFGSGRRWWSVNRGQTHFVWHFLLDLSGASVRKHTVRIRMRRFYGLDPWYGPGQPVDYEGVIFVSDARFDIPSFSGNAVVPEGNYSLSIRRVQIFQEKDIKGRVPCDNKTLFLPKDFETTIEFMPPYSGVLAPLPFSDFWWKILGWIIGIIAGLVAGIWALGGLLGFWESPIGHTESSAIDPETGQGCRNCHPPPPTQGYSIQADPVWGIFAAAAAGGIATGLADMIDPYRRGEAASPPDEGDRTKAERLAFSLDYVNLPLPGTPYKIGVDWKFQRRGTATNSYQIITARDDVENIHYLTGYSVRTSDGQTVYPRSETREIGIEIDLSSSGDYVRFKREIRQEKRKLMPEFYIFGILRHRESGVDKWAMFVPAKNKHIGLFLIASDDLLGDWDVMVFIQNVNNTDPKGTPEEQSQGLGGFFYSKNFSLKHDASTGSCLITPEWDLTVKLV